MDLQFAHSVSYETDGAVPVPKIAESLLANERLLFNASELIEECVNGLSIEGVKIGLKTITHESPLREMFFFSLIASFQDKLEKEVPAAVENLLGVRISDKYDTLLTITLLLVAFYGVDYVYRKINQGATPRHIDPVFKELISDVAQKTGNDEATIRRIIESKYNGSKIKTVGKTAIQFFSPSKAINNAKIVLNNIFEIPSDVVREVPSQQDWDDSEPEEISENFIDVEIELHQQDMDRNRQGWSGVIPEISPKRLRMQLYPPIKPQDIYLSARIKGDIILVSKHQDNGEYEPYLFHLLRVK